MQRYYPMRGFGRFDAAARFCSAFDELRHYFRPRRRMKEPPSLAQQRQHCSTRFVALMTSLMAA